MTSKKEVTYTLFTIPGAASLSTHICLEELGAKYQLSIVDKENKSEEFLRRNPRGKVPALVVTPSGAPEHVVAESCAVLLHLTDSHGGVIGPAAGSATRAQFYEWLCYLNSSVQPLFMNFWYPEDQTTEESEEAIAAVKACSERKLTEMFSYINSQLEGKAFLLGDTFTAADAHLHMLCRWGRNMEASTNSGDAFPNVVRHFQACVERPSVARVYAQQGLTAHDE